jgi:chromosome partitioning protein
MFVVTFAGQKGGVGKSTTAICLAAEALHRGLRVLLVDADPQGTIRTWAHVASQQELTAPTVIAMGAAMHRPEHLPQVGKEFDLVVVDCPPREGAIQRSAMMITDLLVLPCGPSAADAWALATTLDTVQEAQSLRPELKAVILITRKQPRTALGKGARDVLEQSGLPVLKTELGYRIGYQEALAAGRGVSTYAPRSEAAQEITNLVNELLPKEIRNGRKTAKKTAR